MEKYVLFIGFQFSSKILEKINVGKIIFKLIIGKSYLPQPTGLRKSFYVIFVLVSVLRALTICYFFYSALDSQHTQIYFVTLHIQF